MAEDSRPDRTASSCAHHCIPTATDRGSAVFLSAQHYRLLAYSLHFLQIGYLVPMRDEGVKLIYICILPTWILRTLKTVLRPAVLQAASGNRTGLISEPAAAAVAGKMHRTESAVQAAERKVWIISCKIFHLTSSLFILPAYMSSRDHHGRSSALSCRRQCRYSLRQ